MVELKRGNGDETGSVVSLTRFPFSVGRRDADLLVVEAGVWERHFAILKGEGGTFILEPTADAPVAIGGRVVREAQPLRNGDWIDCGAARFQFCLAPTVPKSLIWRERLIWAVLWGLLLFQLVAALGWRP